METFEELATADIANFLYNQLKFFDGVETVFGANVDLKLDNLLNFSERRDDIINTLRENAVSAGNTNYRFILSC